MNNDEPIKIIECGCCSCFHRVDFGGDCRDDSNRFADLEDAADRLNCSVIEAYEEEVTASTYDEEETETAIFTCGSPILPKNPKPRKKHYVDVTVRLAIECVDGVDPAEIPNSSTFDFSHLSENGRILNAYFQKAQNMGQIGEEGQLIPLSAIMFEEVMAVESDTPDEDDVDVDFDDDLQDK